MNNGFNNLWTKSDVVMMYSLFNAEIDRIFLVEDELVTSTEFDSELGVGIIKCNESSKYYKYSASTKTYSRVQLKEVSRSEYLNTISTRTRMIHNNVER